MRSKVGKRGECGIRMRLAPLPPQEGVRFRGMVEKRIAESPQARDHLLALGMGPGNSEIAFDDAELGSHALCPFSSRVVPQNTKTLSACAVHSASCAIVLRLAPSIISDSATPRASMQVPQSPTSPLRRIFPSMIWML